MRLRPNLVVTFTLLGVFVVCELITFWTVPAGGSSLKGQLNDVQKEAINLLVELSKLFVTFAYGLLGAQAYFVTQAGDGRFYRTRSDLALMIVTTASAITSLYFGHSILTSLAEMLSNDFLDLRAPQLLWAVRLQYSFVAAATTSLFVFVMTRAGSGAPICSSDKTA